MFKNKKNWTAIWSCLFIVVILASCSSEDNEGAIEGKDILEKPWEETVADASGSEVNFYMWGGDEGVNRYIDEWVAPRVEEKYNITLKRHPMDAPEFLQKLQTEKRAGRDKGSIDVVWLNGENFKNAKDNSLLWGSFTNYLPNFQKYIDKESSEIQYDFGTAVEGMEAPWGKVQYVFLYNAAKVENPPGTFAELAEWVKENPGKFTYPEATDFNGNGFLKHILYDKIGAEALEGKEFEKSLLEEHAGEIWGYLNEIKPYLWKEGETYPASLSELDRLYSQGEVWFTMGYNEARAERLMADGIFPEETKSVVLKPGSIGNLHFLSIPYNSPNVAGALVTINEMMSKEAQLKKLDPHVWGENTILDVDKLSDQEKKQFRSVERGESVLPANTLQDSFISEIDPEYTEWIKENWTREVVQSTAD